MYIRRRQWGCPETLRDYGKTEENIMCVYVCGGSVVARRNSMSMDASLLTRQFMGACSVLLLVPAVILH